MCESEHCKCDEGIFSSTIRHTLQITLFIFLITIALNGVIEIVGEDALAGVLSSVPVVGELIAALVGLIPNCASSVAITQLYVKGVIGAGPMMSGLLASSGVGVLLLCRMNKKRVKQNVGIIGFIYVVSVFWGVLLEMFHVSF